MTRARDCHFETERLQAAEWHSGASGEEASGHLAEFVCALLTPAVTGQLPPSWQGDYDTARALRWIDERDQESTQLLIRSRELGKPIGLMILHEGGTMEAPELRIGYLIREESWGQGYATELLRGLVGWARTSDYRRTVAGVAHSNAPSIRVLEKSGFVRSIDEEEDSSELFFIVDLSDEAEVHQAGPR